MQWLKYIKDILIAYTFMIILGCTTSFLLFFFPTFIKDFDKRLCMKADEVYVCNTRYIDCLLTSNTT